MSARRTSVAVVSEVGESNVIDARGKPSVTRSLSPSRAADYMTCPLLYRFRSVDRIPETPSLSAVRGTLVHGVLERLFDLPASQRSIDRAADLIEPAWDEMRDEQPELLDLVAALEDQDEAGWLSGARDLLEKYYELEDPTRLEPAEREMHVEVTLESGLVLRGYVDRLDVAPDGAMRVVDYKTGKAPRDGFESKAMFQMRFYALVLWKMRGEVPKLLQLLYLGSGEVLRYAPDEEDLNATARKLDALWGAIEKSLSTGEFRPNPTKLCDWCDHKSRCPSWGGTPPPYPRAIEINAPNLVRQADEDQQA